MRRTHHERLRDICAHEGDRAELVEDLDEDAVGLGVAAYPGGVTWHKGMNGSRAGEMHVLGGSD